MPPTAVNATAAEFTLDQRVRSELVRTAYVDSLYGGLFATVVAVLLGWEMSASFPARIVGPWLAFALVANILRLVLRWAYFRNPVSPGETDRWSRLFAVVSGLSGLAWGWGGWLFAGEGQAGSRIFVVLVLAGLSTGAARLLIPVLAANLSYLYFCIVPLMARLITDPAIGSPILAVMTVLYLGYMTVASRQQLATLRRTVRLSLENTALVSSLGAEIEHRNVVEDELRSASHRAEAANHAKSEFLATMSHEIRTPMNGILGMLQIVRDSPLSPEQRTQIDTAASSADTLLDLLNDILDFSKIEAGHLQLEAITFAPASTFRTVVELLRPRAQAKSLTLVVDFDPQLPAAVVGDPTRLRQVLLNLLGNAIKFTDRGTVTLRVSRVASPQADAPAIQFTVRDTGIGMDAASVGRLFTPFTQADSSMSRRFGGTGLGLAISQKLVEAMNGKISARSEPGRGSEFTFTLRFQQPGADEAARVRYTNRDRFTPPSFQGRILVVEDDRINQRVVIHFLKQMGLTVTLAEDGLDAVKAATSGNCDLVLMDCQLPGIDGIEATRRIRENLAGRRLPIIALTANASTQDRAACFSAGMDDFIAKPVRAEQLAAMFEKWLPPSPGRN